MGIHYREDTKKWVVRIRNSKLNIDYTASFKSKTLAKNDEIRVKAEIEAGTFMKQNEKMTFKEASQLYMQNMIEGSCKDTTKTSYYGYLNNHILPYFGNKALFNITKLDCDAFITSLKNKKCKHINRTKEGLKEDYKKQALSNETINHIMTLCNAIFEYMVDSDVIIKNPMKKVKKLKNNRPEAQFLTPEECNKLLNTAQVYYPQYYTILFLSIITGMRQGEALALTWNDIDLINGYINVNKTFTKGKVTTTKTSFSIRKIKIANKLITALKKHKLATPPNKLNLVFPNQEGNYINCSNLLKRFLRPCLEKAELKNITWHQLRHSCITALSECQVPTKCIQKRAGHSSETTTLKFYTHVTDTMEEFAANVLEEKFG